MEKSKNSMQKDRPQQSVHTSTTLRAKPDWPAAKQRWTAFWDRQNTDRPLLDLSAPLPNRAERFAELQPPKDNEARYLDPEYLSRQWHCWFETSYYAGEAFPSVGYLLAGYAQGCGSDVVFDKASVWHHVSLPSMTASMKWHPGPSDPWRHKFDKVLNRLLDEAPGQFLVSYQCQVMANDLLTLIRGVDDFMADIAFDTDQCVRRLREMWNLWAETFDHFRQLIASRQQDHVWANLWSPKFFMISQSDMSCMISPTMFGQYVMKELEWVAERYSDTIWYHLDGPGAIRHLPMLLSRPFVRVIQWVPGAGQPDQGPAWLEIYRQVQKAGRNLDLYFRSSTEENLKGMEYLIRHLRPEGVIIRSSVDTPEQADELIAKASQWCGSHANRTT
jgi:5-methyltetrahydrofolate--homocysteine methyltransferase